MTRLFKNFGLMCIAASMLTSSAFAEINAVQESNTTVKISGCTENEKKEKNVIANVLAPDKTYENLLSADSSEYGNILVYHNQGKTTSKGEFEFTVDMTGKTSGLYSVYVTDGGEKANLIYTDMDKNADAINWLTGLAKAPTEDELGNYRADLGFYNDLYEKAEKGEILDLLFEAVESGKLDFDEDMTPIQKRDKAILAFNKASVISGLNSNVVSDIFEYADYIEIEESDLAEFMDLSFVTKSNFISELTTRMSNQDFEKESDFDEALIEEFVLSAVRFPDGNDNLTELLNSFKAEMGITKKVTSTIASKISGKNYTSAEDLAEAVNESESSKPSGSVSGKGSGGFGGGSNKIPQVEIEPNKNENANPDEYHIDIFTDLENVEWAREAIVYLAELDIIHGDGNFKFNPENNITREEFTKMVVQAFAPNAEEAEIAFTDVLDSDWFAPYIKKAKGLGIVNGQSETMFGSGQNITRQDMAVIAYNAAAMYGISFNDESKTVFEDDESVAEYAKIAVYGLRNGGVLNGKENNAFCPLDNATRAEAAKIIYGLLEM